MAVDEARFVAGADTLADALGLDALDVDGLPRYRVGSELPRAREKQSPRSPAPYLASSETDALLGECVVDAEAGVTDAAIAKKAGLSRHQVYRWRRRQGIERKPGRPTTWKRASAIAIDLFGRSPSPVVMPIASPVSGAWTPPEYVLRFPLDYEHFAQLVTALVEAEIPMKKIASGLGVRERDVSDACRLWAARGRA